MNGLFATLLTAAAMAIAGVTSGFTDSIMTALSLRSIQDVKQVRNRTEPAASPCPTPGQITLRADRDASVASGFTTTNYARTTTLTVGSDTDQNRGAGDQRVLIGFDFGAIHPFCTVTAATFSLYATSASADRTIGVYRVAAEWSEGGLTWDNQPKTNGSPATASTDTGWLSWDVTDHVAAMVAGANNGLLLRDEEEGEAIGSAQVFQSRDSAPYVQSPTLVVTLG